MSDTYKLIYFNLRGRGEPIRLVFALAGVEYEDFRIELEDWEALRNNYEGWGTLPILRVNGKTPGICQTPAILRYLAKQFNLGGDNEWEDAKMDEMADAVNDFLTEFGKHFRETDEVKKAAEKKIFGDVTVPKFYTKFEAIIKSNGSGLLVGKKVSWVDLQLAHYIEFFEPCAPGVIDNFPNLKKLKETVYNLPEIKTWVEKRPVTVI